MHLAYASAILRTNHRVSSQGFGFWPENRLLFFHHQRVPNSIAFSILPMIQRTFPMVPQEDILDLCTHFFARCWYTAAKPRSRNPIDRQWLECLQKATSKPVGLSHLPYPTELRALDPYTAKLRCIRCDSFLLLSFFGPGLMGRFLPWDPLPSSEAIKVNPHVLSLPTSRN